MSFGVYKRRVDELPIKPDPDKRDEADAGSMTLSLALLLPLLPPPDPLVRVCKADDGRLLLVLLRPSTASRSFTAAVASRVSQLLLASLLWRPSELFLSLETDPSGATNRRAASSSRLMLRKCDAVLAVAEAVESLSTLPTPSRNCVVVRTISSLRRSFSRSSPPICCHTSARLL